MAPDSTPTSSSTNERRERPIIALGYKAPDDTIVVTDVLCMNFPPMTNEQMAELLEAGGVQPLRAKPSMIKPKYKVTVVEQPWMLLPKKEEPGIIKPTGYGMTIAEAMTMMKEARAALKGKSVLNPELNAVDAWNIVWQNLIGLTGYHEPHDKLSSWMLKRVRQVCTNKMNPDLPDDASKLLPMLPPEPEPEPFKTKPTHPKPRPFERKFS